MTSVAAILSFVVGVLGLVLLTLKNPLASGIVVSSAVFFVGAVVSDGVSRLEKALVNARPLSDQERGTAVEG